MHIQFTSIVYITIAMWVLLALWSVYLRITSKGLLEPEKKNASLSLSPIVRFISGFTVTVVYIHYMTIWNNVHHITSVMLIWVLEPLGFLIMVMLGSSLVEKLITRMVYGKF